MIQTTVLMRVWCDAPECVMSTDTDNGGGMRVLTQAVAREDAKAEGWVRSGRRDLCPAHRPDTLLASLDTLLGEGPHPQNDSAVTARTTS